MNSWENGTKAGEVKRIIDQNFEELDERIIQIANAYIRHFLTSDWTNGKIFIGYSEYKKSNPCVDVYIRDNNGYSLVYGGYEVKDNGIELQTDLPYEGRVVIR